MKVIIFPHTPKEFEDPYSLYMFLGSYLKDRGGYYRIRKDSHLSDDVPRGSIVFFHKTDMIVGLAVVEVPPKMMEDSDYDVMRRESEMIGCDYEPDMYDRIIKFFPETVVAFQIHHWIPRKLVEEKTGRQNIYRDYIELPSDAILQILSLIP